MISSAQDGSHSAVWKKLLYHPLTWLAVGLHALLLIIPFDPSMPSAAELASEEAEPEAIAVDILNLADISSTPPPPGESLPSTPPPAPPNAPPAPAPPSAAVPPSVSQTPLPAPAATNPAASPTQPAANPAAAPAADPVPPAYDPGQDQTLFIDNLGALNLQDYTDTQGLPPAKFFHRPENAGYFIDGEVPAAGARSARWMDKSPDAVLAELKANYTASGIVFNQLGDYGGEVLYELVTAAGEPFMYISLARLSGSSLLVIWQSNPLAQAAPQ
ncbi:MAG: hypothetical protein WBC73_16815 [Phormidesmis sp.]